MPDEELSERESTDALCRKLAGKPPLKISYDPIKIPWRKAMKMMGWGLFRRRTAKQGIPFTEGDLVEMVKKYLPAEKIPAAVSRQMIESHVGEEHYAGWSAFYYGLPFLPVDFYKLKEVGRTPEGDRQYQIRCWNVDA